MSRDLLRLVDELAAMSIKSQTKNISHDGFHLANPRNASIQPKCESKRFFVFLGVVGEGEVCDPQIL